MKCVGPFWRQKPSAITTFQKWGWCYLYLNSQGQICAFEWIS
jgi:hypothetical protein